MNDRRAVFLGLLMLLAVVTYPFWYTLAVGVAGPRPELELPSGQSECVEGTQYMTAHHMELLNSWRDAVVREGRMSYTSETYGKTFDMSLTRTCLKCHGERETFCDKCHGYADVTPYCWSCHVESDGSWESEGVATDGWE